MVKNTALAFVVSYSVIRLLLSCYPIRHIADEWCPPSSAEWATCMARNPQRGGGVLQDHYVFSRVIIYDVTPKVPSVTSLAWTPVNGAIH
jgi:hypothetical protein